VQKLTPNVGVSFAAMTENSGWVGAPTVEAPAMFKRDGWYYLLFDRLSCFGPQGERNACV
jgi:beta-xylosidase